MSTIRGVADARTASSDTDGICICIAEFLGMSSFGRMDKFDAARAALDHYQKRLLLAAMNWMQLAIELTREAMKSRAEPAKPTEPTDLGTALSQQFGLIDRQMEAIVQNLKAHNAKLERSIRRQRVWNYILAVAVVAVAVIAFLR